MFSTPLRLMVRPFAGYRELAKDPGRSFVPGALRLAFVVAAFVAFTATGRLAPIETLFAMFSFAWLPLVHATGIALTARLVAPRVSVRQAYALHVESLGPWLLVFLIASGLCLFAPSPAQAIFPVLAPLLLGATAWSVVLVYALFRAGLGLARSRAAVGTALFLFLIVALVVLYYFSMGQLWPIL